MPAIKECAPAKTMNISATLADIIKYTVPLWQAQNPDSQNISKTSISDKVNANISVSHPNIPAAQSNPNPSNYGPAAPYGPPYTVSPHSYGIIGSYLDRRVEAMDDFTDRVPGKQLHTFPVSGNEGLYGYTRIGDVHAGRREDLIGTEFAKEVDVHESIHTPDEYETRRIVEWMMSREMPKYNK